MAAPIGAPVHRGAAPEHPSLVDPTHQMDALFGVVNIPNVDLDRRGRADRASARAGLAGKVQYPESLSSRLEEQAAALETPKPKGVSRSTRAASSAAARTAAPTPTRSATGSTRARRADSR